jgi:hypothetical protein
MRSVRHIDIVTLSATNYVCRRIYTSIFVDASANLDTIDTYDEFRERFFKIIF